MADDAVQSLAAAFERPREEDWRALVDKALKGVGLDKLITYTSDGVALNPLYQAADPVFLSRSKAVWAICQHHDHPEPAACNARLLTDLAAGVRDVQIRLDLGLGGTGGVLVADKDDFAALMKDILLDVAPVHLLPCAHFHDAARLLYDLARHRGYDPASLTGSLGADPLAQRLAGGPLRVDALVQFVPWARDHLPCMKAIQIHAVGVHDAGATPAQELAWGLACAVDYARILVEAGLEAETVFATMGLTLAADADMMQSLAKLRAARLIWSRLGELWDISLPALPLSAQGSARMLTRLDPWSNLLRNTVAGLAAAVGGADRLTLMPHDSALGVSTEFGLKLARNAQFILAEESHLAQVGDPASGAGALEVLTQELAATAWGLIQEIDGVGGAAKAAGSGLMGNWLTDARAERATQIAKRRPAITGISGFADLDEQPVTAEPIDGPALVKAARQRRQASGFIPQWPGEGACLPVRRDAAAFEALREAGAGRPILVVTLGNLAVHGARTSWVRAALAAGGLKAVEVDESQAVQTAADWQSEACIICFSGPDSAYAERLLALMEALAHPDRFFWRAGRPGKADPPDLKFIYDGCDILKSLQYMQEQMA